MRSNGQTVLTCLYEDVVVGTFSFGTKLGEEQLVARYATKRHVLREAFMQLEEFGFVERIPNRGVYVREPNPKEVTELFEVRELLEIHAAMLMPLPASKNITNRMRDIQAQHSLATQKAQYREVLHLNTEFHRVQFLACGNATLADAIEVYATRTHPITAMKFGTPVLMEEVIAQHEAIIEAMTTSDHNALADVIRSHFDMARVQQYRQQYIIRHGDQGSENEQPRRRRIID